MIGENRKENQKDQKDPIQNHKENSHNILTFCYRDIVEIFIFANISLIRLYSTSKLPMWIQIIFTNCLLRDQKFPPMTSLCFISTTATVACARDKNNMYVI